jgi:RNA polymerase sigma-70 factor (ECF subfamily)
MSSGRGAGGEFDLSELMARHRRELHVHCYRMLASFEEAEDAVQETFVRAWRASDKLEEASGARAWLYRIATNVCLDALRARRRRPQPAESFADLPWLEPYPDHLLDELTAEERPDARAVGRETIALTFLAALQALPPRQRAVLIARDVHRWSAKETADVLDTSVAAANSALQRARAVMRRHRVATSAKGTTSEERELLDQFVDAHERGDAAAAIAIAAQDIRVTMPPMPMCFVGIDAIKPLLDRAFGAGSEGDWKLVPTQANRMPAAASYLRRHGDSIYRAYKLDVLRIESGAVAEITTFGSGMFARFGLPETLTAR